MEQETELIKIVAQLRYYTDRMEENPIFKEMHAIIAEKMEELIKQYKDLIFNAGVKNEQ